MSLKHRILTAALAAALGVGPALLAGQVTPPGQDKVALRFGPAEGTRLTYSLSSVVNVDGKGFMGVNLSLDADSRGEIRFLSKVSSHDTVRADLTSPGIEVNIRLPDKTTSQKLGTTGGDPLEVIFNKTGKVETIRNPEVLGEGNPFNISIPQILRDYFPAFPAEPVGRGESWGENRRLTIPFQGLDLQVNLAITYTLDDVYPGNDGRVAQISAVYKVTVSGSRDLGGTEGTFEGQGQGTGALEVQIDKGWFSQYRVDFNTDAAFVMKNKDKRLAEFPFKFSAFAEVVLLSAQEPTPIIR